MSHCATIIILLFSDTASEQMDNTEATNDGKTNLMDLPNELLAKIYKYVDLPSRFRMRLNKRLDQIQLTITLELEGMRVSIDPGRIQLAMYSNDANIVSRSPSKNSYIREYFDFNRLGFGLQRLARSTRVKDVRIEMQPRLTEAINNVIDALLSFEICNELNISVNTMDEFTLPQLTYSRFVTLSKSVKKVNCKAISNIAAQELSDIRKV
ncbi:hypothetical protein PRIPAC_85661 [Pristionchus pacificus]|uniref:F-box domain-containing protein n=1 Tax=Pristionchus pacificus TaxID=54126 RepID=A0A2A6BSQ6_PRIPA|nr:hypothetical protein PRIPAC_85661 [Pristionchus pacificus]|eukprot:PDM68944.1 hypothetical protein PRIPAC_47246 [Pristionchus pacificus]